MLPVGNQMNMPGNMNMATIPKETKKKKKIKRLNLTFKEGTYNDIHIQCTSNEKMESIINKFWAKSGILKKKNINLL